MRRDDVRFAVAAREDGLRRVRRLTVRIGAVGVAASAIIAIGFSHLSGAASASTRNGTGSTGTGSTGQSGAGQNGAGQNNGQQGGSLQVPVQNPAPAQGPVQGVSGGS